MAYRTVNLDDRSESGHGAPALSMRAATVKEWVRGREGRLLVDTGGSKLSSVSDFPYPLENPFGDQPSLLQRC